MFLDECGCISVGTLKTYVENFKTSNIQYTDEVLTLLFGVQSFVTFLDQPFEETIEDTLAESTDGVGDLLDVTALGDEFVTDLNAGFQQVLVQFSAIATEQFGNTATFFFTILFSLFFATTLLEFHATHVHDSGGDLVNIFLFLLGEAQDIEGLLLFFERVGKFWGRKKFRINYLCIFCVFWDFSFLFLAF